MHILDYLIELSTSIPGSHEAKKIIAHLPENIKNAIRSNHGNLLKNRLSEKTWYANETKVTNYKYCDEKTASGNTHLQ